MFRCTECHTNVAVPRAALKTATCKRCGEVYLLPSQQRIYPSLHMRPIDIAPPADGCCAVSKWMPTETRPIEQGFYDCRFRHTEPRVFRLYWNGVTFITGKGQRVALHNFLTWRGLLA